MGLSVMLHLLRYRELAVVHYSGVPCALHLQHAQQSLNLGQTYNPQRFTIWLTADAEIPSRRADHAYFALLGLELMKNFDLSARFEKAWYANRKAYSSGNDLRPTSSPSSWHLGCALRF